MKNAQFDVIVAGGGPAGSITGYHLARAGLRTAVLDAQKFPRAKPCGGGLQARAALQIPFDVSEVLRGTMRHVRFSFGLTEPCTRTYHEPLVYGVLRSEFDAFLLERAAEAGASIRQPVRVWSFDAPADGPVVVHTDRGDFTAWCLVGADGANSVVGRLLNARGDYFWQAAVYCEIPVESLNSGALAEECMQIDWGTLPSGYAWVFPKRGYVNVGAGGPVRIARLLRPYVSRFLESKQLLKPGRLEQLTFTGHQLPTLTRRTRLANRRILLVGDAAGLVDPFTGDGISFACHSARLAAECIAQALGLATPDLSGYQQKLKSELARELLISRRVLALSVAFPNFVHRLFRQNDRLWQTFCRILRGEESFLRLKKDILGPLEFAWRAVDLLARRLEEKALGAPGLPEILRQPIA
jgi:geranylgeranyl reductase family protein